MHFSFPVQLFFAMVMVTLLRQPQRCAALVDGRYFPPVGTIEMGSGN
jgi:hypothetical protein